MKCIFYTSLTIFTLMSNALAADVIMSNAQQQTLGISVSPITKNTLITSRKFPSEVVIPVGQERIVSAPQSGLIEQLYVAAGQEVRKGQKIATLISPELLNLQRDYLQAKTQSKLASKNLSRDAELLKDGIIPQRRYLETESVFEEINASLAQRKQALQLAGISEDKISSMSASSGMTSGITLTAPISGQIIDQMVTSGQRVDMATPLYRIANLNPLWLEIHAPLEGLPFVKNGMPVEIPKLKAKGKIIAVIRNVNKTDQTMHLRAEITEGTEKLSPGQMVEAEISLGAQVQNFSIPKTALARQGSNTFVFVQTSKGFHPLKVNVVFEQSEEAVVDGGFKGNERIAVSGIAAIKGTWLGLGGE